MESTNSEKYNAKVGDDNVPGEDPSLKSKLLCMGSSLLEKFTPIKSICDHLVGLHCYSGELKRQVIAHHYCTMLNEDMRQCIIYDSDQVGAKLIGIEYVISEKLFKGLSEEEKKFWHSHIYEVKSGVLTSPNNPEIAEKEAMKTLIKTYGKTIHTWEFDKHNLPIGVPTIMMACIHDNMTDWSLNKIKDDSIGIDTADKKQRREDIEEPEKIVGADDWQRTGKATILVSKEIDISDQLEALKISKGSLLHGGNKMI